MSTPESPRTGVEPNTIALQRRTDVILPPLSPINPILSRLIAPGHQFTTTERMLVLKAHGLTSKQIGVKLGLVEQTVKNHIGREVELSELGSPIGVIVGLKSEKMSPLITEGLNFNLYRRLTKRERDVLDAMADRDMWGKDLKGVADKLKITEQTTKNHLLQIYPKLGVRNKTQAIIYRLFIPDEMMQERRISGRVGLRRVSEGQDMKTGEAET